MSLSVANSSDDTVLLYCCFLLTEKFIHSKMLSYNLFFFHQSKIKDREWVLDECLLRVADDFDSTEELLKYGLLGTSWEIFNRIDEEDEKEKLPFKIELTPDDHHRHHGMDEEEMPCKDFNGR